MIIIFIRQSAEEEAAALKMK